MEVNKQNVDLLRAPLILDLDDTNPHSYMSFIDRFRLRVSIIIRNMRVFHQRNDYLILRVKCSDEVDVELYIDMFTSSFEAFRFFGEKNWIVFNKKEGKDLVLGSRMVGFEPSYNGFCVDLKHVRVGHAVLVEGVITLKKVAEALESGGKVTSAMKLGLGQLCFNIMEGMRFHEVCRLVVNAYLIPTYIDGSIAKQWAVLSSAFWRDLYEGRPVLHHFDVLAVCSKNEYTPDLEEFEKNLPKIK